MSQNTKESFTLGHICHKHDQNPLRVIMIYEKFILKALLFPFSHFHCYIYVYICIYIKFVFFYLKFSIYKYIHGVKLYTWS